MAKRDWHAARKVLRMPRKMSRMEEMREEIASVMPAISFLVFCFCLFLKKKIGIDGRKKVGLPCFFG